MLYVFILIKQGRDTVALGEINWYNVMSSNHRVDMSYVWPIRLMSSSVRNIFIVITLLFIRSRCCKILRHQPTRLNHSFLLSYPHVSNIYCQLSQCQHDIGIVLSYLTFFIHCHCWEVTSVSRLGGNRGQTHPRPVLHCHPCQAVWTPFWLCRGQCPWRNLPSRKDCQLSPLAPCNRLSL